jgi:plastocyanin domain-containing protein
MNMKTQKNLMRLRTEIRPNNFRRIAFWLTLLSLLFTAATAFEAQAQTKRKPAKPKTQTAAVEVNQNGYQPASLKLKKGVPARVTFIRRERSGCATEVVFPDYGIRRELTLNQSVVISFTPSKTGEFTFACGMNMVRGRLIVQ